MRRSIKLAAVVFSATLFSCGLANAQNTQGRVVNTKTKPPVKSVKKAPTPAKETKPQETVTVRTHEDLDVTPEEKKKASTAHAVATAEEQRIAGQVRGLQVLMQKEEQALAQRLTYAGKVRAQGLAKNDQKLLDQAEGLERQALDYYQKRVQQIEGFNVSKSGTSTRKPSVRQPTRATSPSSSYRSSSRTPSRSSRTSRTRSRR